jgi:hypothetical protein
MMKVSQIALVIVSLIASSSVHNASGFVPSTRIISSSNPAHVTEKIHKAESTLNVSDDDVSSSSNDIQAFWFMSMYVHVHVHAATERKRQRQKKIISMY